MKNRVLATAGILTLLLLAEGAWVWVFMPDPAEASRNSAGTESLPNTFVAGTTISSSAVNANFADLGVEITSSLDRSGRGGMLASLRGIDGTVAAPAFSWTSETGSGLYRIGANDLGLSVGGTKQAEFTTAAATIVQPLTCSSTLTSTGAFTASSTAAFNGAATFSSTATATGAGQATTTPDTVSGSMNATIRLTDSGISSNNGGMVLLGFNAKYPISLKAAATDNTSNGAADLVIGTRNATSDATTTERVRVKGAGGGITTSTPLTIGSSGTATSQMNFGSCTTNAGTPSTCTATVASGAKCFATGVSATYFTDQGVTSVSSTTLTITTASGIAHTFNYLCF